MLHTHTHKYTWEHTLTCGISHWFPSSQLPSIRFLFWLNVHKRQSKGSSTTKGHVNVNVSHDRARWLPHFTKTPCAFHCVCMTCWKVKAKSAAKKKKKFSAFKPSVWEMLSSPLTRLSGLVEPVNDSHWEQEVHKGLQWYSRGDCYRKLGVWEGEVHSVRFTQPLVLSLLHVADISGEREKRKTVSVQLCVSDLMMLPCKLFMWAGKSHRGFETGKRLRSCLQQQIGVCVWGGGLCNGD